MGEYREGEGEEREGEWSSMKGNKEIQVIL